MNLLAIFLPALAAAVLGFALTPLAMRLARRLGALDEPGPRKVHSAPVPRLGGLAVLAAVALVGSGLWASGRLSTLAGGLPVAMVLGLVPIFVVSLIDDLYTVRALPRALVHVGGASIAVALGVRLAPEIHLFGQPVHIGWLAVPISVLWLVGVTNAFNLVDGLDGLSAGLALISAASLGSVAFAVGRPELATIAFVWVGALVGFLPYNLHPARTFLGDVGSTAIGFSLACLALKGGSTLSSGLAVLVPVVVLGLPIAETLVSMVRRLARRFLGAQGGGIFEADRQHFHHRLLSLGLDHRRAVLVLHGVGLLLGVVGVSSLFLAQRQAAVLLVAIAIAALVGLARLGYDEFDVIRRGDMLRLYEVPVLRSALFVGLLDLAISSLAIYLAWGVKYDDWLVELGPHKIERFLAVGPLSVLLVFTALGLYRRSWRIATVSDLSLVWGGIALSTLVGIGFGRLAWADPLPVTYFGIYFLLFGFGAAGVRCSYRVLNDWMRRSRRQVRGEPVLIYGAGVSGSLALREIHENEDLDIRPVGFIDDDPRKRGKVVAGYPVLGDIDCLDRVLAERGPLGLIVASRKIPAERVRRAGAACQRMGTWMKIFSVGFDDEGHEAA